MAGGEDGVYSTVPELFFLMRVVRACRSDLGIRRPRISYLEVDSASDFS